MTASTANPEDLPAEVRSGKGYGPLVIAMVLVMLLEMDREVWTQLVPLPLNQREVFLPALALFCIWRLFHRKEDAIRLLLRSKVTILYLGFVSLAFVSMLWAPDRAQTFGSAMALILALPVTFYLALRYRIEELLDSIPVAMVVILLCSAILFVLNRGQATDDIWFFRFKGVMAHSQRLSALLAISGLILFGRLLDRQRFGSWWLRTVFSWPCLVGMILVTFLTFTRAWTTFYLFCLVLLFFGKGNWMRKLLVIGAGLILLSALLSGFLWTVYQRRAGEALVELTGRIELWQELSYRIPQKPLLGHGFASFVSTPILVAWSWAAPHAHNLWLQVLYELGILGIVLINSFYIAAWYLLRRCRPRGWREVEIVLLFVFLCSLTGVLIGFVLSPFDVICGTLAFATVAHARARRTASRRVAPPAAEDLPPENASITLVGRRPATSSEP